jgi:formate--tetrahydrofolate ligase
MVNRISNVVLAYDKKGNKITTKDLKVDGAMSAWLIDALNPNLMQTLEGQPLLVHGGPFANISLGQNSIISDEIGLRLSDYYVIECGFGSDIGFEKFANIKTRLSNNYPDCVIIVATLKAIKHLGEKRAHKTNDIIKAGFENLLSHIKNIQKFKITPIVCINRFENDNIYELNCLKDLIQDQNINAHISSVYEDGGEGSISLAESVILNSSEKKDFNFLYNENDSMETKIKKIATNLYGAKDIRFLNNAKEKLKNIDLKNFYPCIAKNPLSISHDPEIDHKSSWTLPIEDILIYEGAKLVVPVTGNIKLMPGTGSKPSFTKIKINLENNKIEGLF